MNEFSLVDLIRQRVALARADVELGIGDDAALLNLPAGRQLVACTDTLVEGVHFVRGTAPEDIGWKSLAVNLSDLAAMGAAPAWALLALTLPEADPVFVGRFADGFGELARIHEVALVGGDTTQGPLAATVTLLGTVPPGQALTRAGARVGDGVYVTGTLGDAAGALSCVRDSGPGLRRQDAGANIDEADGPEGEPQERRVSRDSEGRRAAVDGRVLLARMRRPEPRIAAGLALRGVAGACIDVSDGLLADLGHVCKTSGVGAELDVETLPVSAALRAAFDEASCRRLALSGGDDYELCFTASADRAGEIEAAFAALDLRVTCIGRIVAGAGVRVLDRTGNTIETPCLGWEHFS